MVVYTHLVDHSKGGVGLRGLSMSDLIWSSLSKVSRASFRAGLRVLSIQVAITCLLAQGPGIGSRAWWGKGSDYQQSSLLKKMHEPSLLKKMHEF